MDAATPPLDVASIAVGLFGGLALFLYGMDKITESLKSVAGSGMRTVLARLTGNRVLGALTGAFVTAVVQSSSVTTVLLVGFISAGLMTLAQSVGVILGANVGSTVTAQIIAFNVTQYGLPMLTVGFAIQFASRREVTGQIGAMLMGLGLIFFGMDLMSGATGPLRAYQPFVEAMKGIDSPLIAIGISTLFTALVQSSAATTGIVIVLASQGLVDLEGGIALALGANIGTCITALLAALGKPRAAVQAATAHVLFNVIGVLIWFWLIPDLAEFVRRISPAHAELSGAARLAAETPRQIANAHTAFNMANTLLFLPFTGLFAALVRRLVPDRLQVKARGVPRFLDDSYLTTPPLAIDRMRFEVGHLGELVLEVQRQLERPPLSRTALETRVADVQTLHDAIVDYARRVLQKKVTARDTEELERVLGAANHIQNIGDTIAINIGSLVSETQRRGLEVSPETQRMMQGLLKSVGVAISNASRAVADEDLALARVVIESKHEIVDQVAALKRRLADRLASGGEDRLTLYRLESQLVETLQRLYYFAKRIAKTVAVDIPEPEVPLDEAA
jgi:phosphate:Na+ symporter